MVLFSVSWTGEILKSESHVDKMKLNKEKKRDKEKQFKFKYGYLEKSLTQRQSWFLSATQKCQRKPDSFVVFEFTIKNLTHNSQYSKPTRLSLSLWTAAFFITTDSDEVSEISVSVSIRGWTWQKESSECSQIFHPFLTTHSGWDISALTR